MTTGTSSAGNRATGFTLLELLVVLALLGLMLALVRIEIDSERPGYRIRPQGPARELPASLALAWRGDDTQDWQSSDEAPLVLDFYPDGSTSGGQVRVGEPGSAYLLKLDWLLGRIEVARAADAEL